MRVNSFRSERNDLVHYISKFGGGIIKAFKIQPKTSAESRDYSETFEHAVFSFGNVYANELAKEEFAKKSPRFPVGSIIVREKNLDEESVVPETVLAMVKRESGFSKTTSDWEFFLFEGKRFQIQRRETAGNCATCHSRAKENDWVFKNYKQESILTQ